MIFEWFIRSEDGLLKTVARLLKTLRSDVVDQIAYELPAVVRIRSQELNWNFSKKLPQNVFREVRKSSNYLRKPLLWLSNNKCKGNYVATISWWNTKQWLWQNKPKVFVKMSTQIVFLSSIDIDLYFEAKPRTEYSTKHFWAVYAKNIYNRLSYSPGLAS